ncbi:uncharacterized protein K02A2.6 [Trichonephila clavata]|uniref:Uncharacterized protein K02A2.6 n=1 Tax=Trichonephila clavata TaxID=2740835 RepID=A0A8X6GN56_TRICU|nr:uncharacterized protein K02A2.6 [Trichonephila clavata]
MNEKLSVNALKNFKNYRNQWKNNQKNEVVSVYVPGKNLVIVDALSRVQSTTDKFDEVLGQEATVKINLLTQASPTKWEEIAKMTTDDPEMQDVLFHVNNGWPEKRKTKIAVQPYWH